MRLPDFICVGAQKAGTTWLYEQVLGHPDVFMPKKELDFFLKPLDLSWYGAHFDGAAEQQICGDISPNYAAFEGLAARIHEVCPNARIIHMLRDPVERAFSQWKMARFIGRIPRDVSFIDAFRENMQYMRRRGQYVTILKEYETFFPLGERSAVFFYDQMRTNPVELVRRVLAFLGIDEDWQSPKLHEIVLPSPEYGLLPEDDARELAAYYLPFDQQLRARLGLTRLPWEP
jgi:hypothetical protein